MDNREHLKRTALALKMLDILGSGRRFSKAELAELLGTKERNIVELRRALDEAGVRIDQKSGPSGGYQLIGKHSILKMSFSENERAALNLLTEEIIENSHRVYRSELLTVLGRVMHNHQASDEGWLSYGFDHLLSVDNNKYNQMHKEIYSAMTHRLSIEVEYDSYNKPHTPGTKRKLNPYHMVSFNDTWYVIAKDESDQLIKIFKLIRFHSIKILSQQFKTDSSFNPKEFIDSNQAKFFGRAINLKMKIYEPYAKSVREIPFGTNSVVTEIEDGIHFETTVNGEYNLKKLILSMGSGCVVLEPKEIVELITLEIEHMMGLYKR